MMANSRRVAEGVEQIAWLDFSAARAARRCAWPPVCRSYASLDRVGVWRDENQRLRLAAGDVLVAYCTPPDLRWA